MNSMGVSPYVNYIYNDLIDGLIIFQLYDICKPGIVDWNKVIKKFNKLKANFEKIGKFQNFSTCLKNEILLFLARFVVFFSG